MIAAVCSYSPAIGCNLSKHTIMGQQHNKVEKRKRRKAYLKRKKEAAKQSSK